MKYIISEKEIGRISEVIGSLMIAQFQDKSKSHGIDQNRYRAYIEQIMSEFFKPTFMGDEDDK